MDEPMRPMPMSASFSNMLLVLCPRRTERLQYLDQPPHRRLRPDRNAQPALDAVYADLAYDQPFVEERLECRLAGFRTVEQRQHEVGFARDYADRVAVERAGQPAAPPCVVLR